MFDKQLINQLFIEPNSLKTYFKNKHTLLALLFVSANLLAQETIIVGQTINSFDKSTISSVNIYFKNTTVGVQSDRDGYFMIKTSGKQTTLVFSAVGFKKREINIKEGRSVGIDVLMTEESTLLEDVFVIPGANPALDLMKRVRMLTKENDISKQPNYNCKSTEQNLVLLSKKSLRGSNNQIFNQLRKGNLSNSDTTLVIPLYMHEKDFLISSKEKKLLKKNIFSSPRIGEQMIAELMGDFEIPINFYESGISIFGKSMVNPLAKVGNAYYEYFLPDSLNSASGKQYEIHFRTKNVKNLAFNGKLWIDSSTHALTRIEAELPNKANINFINNFRITQNFEQLPTKYWSPITEEMALSMTNELLSDSLHPNAEIFIKRTTIFQISDTLFKKVPSFANSNYNETNLNEKLNDLNKTPILRTAKFLADVIFTGYIPFGKIDIGKVQQIMRVTDIEGFRMNLPLRTNEKLWKNASIGGYLGYGFKNKEMKYSGSAQIKLSEKKHSILSLSYTNDYRRIDYNYNNYMFRENPLVNGDEDISSSVFAFKSAGKMSERKELTLSFANDWNSDIESNYYLRANQLIAYTTLPMQLGLTSFSNLVQQSATLVTRCSFDEKTYQDHLQRIYIANKKPVIYSILEVGKYSLGSTTGNYVKIMGAIKQKVRFGFGQFSYIADAGYFIGKLPYPLLQIPDGSETGGYSTYQFNMMNYMEYAADKYLNFHSELMLNGLILNQIPVVKNLNLREMVSFNIAYGSLSNSHRSVLDYPNYMQPLIKPYMEVGVGFTNIFKIFTLQSVWRLTDLKKAGVSPWGIRGCLSLGF